MIKPSIKDMFSGKQSKYALVIAIAKRAREISADAELNGRIITEKPVNLAAQDFRDNKYVIFEPEVNN